MLILIFFLIFWENFEIINMSKYNVFICIFVIMVVVIYLIVYEDFILCRC